MTHPTSRRRFLRGLLGGAAVSVALPHLEYFTPRRAFAADTVFPQRFGMFFWGNGILPDRWIPDTVGTGWALSDQLAPLAEHQAELTLFSGFMVHVVNRIAHFSGPAGLLSGMPSQGGDDNRTFAGPSLDQRIAAALGGSTPYRSLEIGVQPGVQGLSYNGPDSLNPPISDPIALYERLYGPTFREPGQGGVVDPRLGLRRSALDAVMADIADLDKRVGTADRERLDQHLTSVRELEQRIARLQEDPPDYAACVRPEQPAPIGDDLTRPMMEARGKVMAELTAMALACDMTRVATYWYSDPLNNTLYPDTTAGHHQLTHDEPGDQPQVHGIILSAMRSFADLLTALKAIPEGDGTLLDNMALLATTDVSYGRTHQIDEFPMLIAGRAGGRLAPAGHVRTDTPDNAGQVPLTLLRALGITADGYGEGDTRTDSSLSEVET